MTSVSIDFVQLYHAAYEICLTSRRDKIIWVRIISKNYDVFYELAPMELCIIPGVIMIDKSREFTICVDGKSITLVCTRHMVDENVELTILF